MAAACVGKTVFFFFLKSALTDCPLPPTPPQAQELHSKHSAEAMKAEKWQFEYRNLHDKYDALLKEKEVSYCIFRFLLRF